MIKIYSKKNPISTVYAPQYTTRMCARVGYLKHFLASGIALVMSLLANIASAQETIGGGTMQSPAVGPAASFGLGEGAVLVKNWNFGSNGTIKNMTDLDTNFNYHDQFGTWNNGWGKYGAHTVASSQSTKVPSSPQPVEFTDTQNNAVREFFSDSLRTYLVPLTGAPDPVRATDYKIGCGSFVAKWELPNGGSHLGKDIIWETRVRYVTPPYFWFAIWSAGNLWNWGAEMDVVETFGYGGTSSNFDGARWHSNSVGGDDRYYYTDWYQTMSLIGAWPYDATEYHIWTWVYRADDTYSVYVDGLEIQEGSIIWTYGATSSDPAIDMTFLFDGAWGHTQIGSVNQPLALSEFVGKYYEWDYSRVYLREPLTNHFFEAENIAQVASSDAVTSHTDGNASGHAFEKLNANAVNDYVTYTLPSVTAGTYDIYIGTKTHDSRGIFQLSIDGVNQGNPQDLYQSNIGYKYLDLGTKTFSTSGNKNFTFTVTGKNSSSYDYSLIIDNIRLMEPGGSVALLNLDSENSTGITVTGSWLNSSSTAGYVGSNYLHDNNSGKGSKSVKYTPVLPAAGTYDVSLNWTSFTNRATNVPVDIVKADGTTTTVTVNQSQNGGQWVSLGLYSLLPSNASVTIRNTGTNGYVIADAVQFSPAMDSENNSGITLTGSWPTSTHESGYLGSNYLHDNNTGKGICSVRYAPSLASGTYEIFLNWTEFSNRATNVPVDIVKADGTTTTVTVDQTQNGGVWVSLGTYSLSSSNVSVTIRNTGTNGYVVADGILFVPQ